MSEHLKFFAQPNLKVAATPGSEAGVFAAPQTGTPVVAGIPGSVSEFRAPFGITLLFFSGLYYAGLNMNHTPDPKLKDKGSSGIEWKPNQISAGDADPVVAVENVIKAAKNMIEANESLVSVKADQDALFAAWETVLEDLQEKGPVLILSEYKAPAKKASGKKNSDPK